MPQFGYRGDIRFLGCSVECGVLPNDRKHQVKVFSTYLWRDVNFGAALNAGSGRSLTELAANPNYANAGEIPITVRGAGMQTVDGFLTRTPTEFSVDLHADYAFRFGGERAATLLFDVFNLTNRRSPDNYDNCSDIGFGTTNSNFGEPLNGCTGATPSFRAPLATRVGLRFDW